MAMDGGGDVAMDGGGDVAGGGGAGAHCTRTAPATANAATCHALVGDAPSPLDLIRKHPCTRRFHPPCPDMVNGTAGRAQSFRCDGMRPPIFGYTWWVATTPRLVKRAAIALALAISLAVACANHPESFGQPARSGPEAIATNLDVPWGIAFLPDGSALIAERDSGAIHHMAQPGVVNNVGGVPGVAARGEGGLLGLTTSGQTVFAYLTTAQDNRVVTMRFDGTSLTEPSAILTEFPRVRFTTADASRSVQTASSM